MERYTPSAKINSRTLSRVDSSSARQTRRFLTADFLLVIALLAGVFYFIWPRLFQIPDKYVPEADLHDVFVALESIKDLCQQEIHEAEDNLPAIRESLFLALSPLEIFQPSNDEWSIKAFVLDESGKFLLGKENRPVWWDTWLAGTSNESQGAYVYSVKGMAFVIFVDTIEPAGIRLVVAKRFPPLFRSAQVKK